MPNLDLGRAISGVSGLFGGDDSRDKGIKGLEKIATEGLDPEILDMVIQGLRGNIQALQRRSAQNISARGGDPTGTVGRAEGRAIQRSLPVQQGAATSAFRAASSDARLRAAALLAGQPEDTSVGDLLGSGAKFFLTKQAGGQPFDFESLSPF